ncbi:MAG: hypothetical protein ACD_15C00162G0006 [uncultured bacterium]|nr:MAG: hypothetical protein ACD_15C00162G0006 [uncultured bacterium]
MDHHLSKNKSAFIFFTLVLSACAFFVFGLHHLSQFRTADEHYWIQERIPAYWDAIMDGKYKKTLINDKPGVTVALISGIGLFFEKNPIQYVIKVDDDLKTYDSSKEKRLNLIFRLPILMFSGFFLFFLFWIIKKAVGNSWIALWSVIFIASSPILIGISQIINPDALLWIFSTGAIFSYFALLKTQEKKFIFLTAVFSGLSILSKYTANILFPFFFFFMLAYWLIEIKNSDREMIKSFFFLQVRNFFLIVLGAFATIIFFLPAIFLKPVYLYRLTLGFGPMKTISFLIVIFSLLILLDQIFSKKSLLVFCKKHSSRLMRILQFFPVLLAIIFIYLIIGRNFFSDWKVFDIVKFDIKEFGYIKTYSLSLWEKIIIEFNPLVFSVSPLIIFSAIFLWIKSSFRKNTDYFFLTFTITSFILSYYLAYIFMDIVATVRYSIIIYPLISLLAAIGLWQIFLSFKKYGQKAKMGITLMLFAASFSSTYLSKPFYFNYTNFFLPRNHIISDAWGYGGYEAAQYLNNLPQSENLTIWADYHGVCDFFIGKCITDYNLITEKYSIDYYVLTRRGEIRYRQAQPKWSLPTGVKAIPYYENPNPAWKIEIGNRPENFVKILKSNP